MTSYNNGLYGIYAFDAQHGVIQHSYTSGMADSGIYVGQCKPCDIEVRANVCERNAVGYEGTNASGRMYVYGNRFVGNRVGATTNSDHQEALVPQDGAQITGNVIAANNQSQTPEQADGGFGIGFGIAGGTNTTVSRNLIVANSVVGLQIASADDLAPHGNRIVGNSFAGNRVDVVYSATASAPGRGNCLSGNPLSSVQPPSLPTSCPPAGAVGATASAGVPDAATAPAVLVRDRQAPIDLSEIAVPGVSLLQDQSSIRW